jgi:gluconokinase
MNGIRIKLNGNGLMSKKVVVMGVSGCGKSTIGLKLATRLEVPFFDGDDYHPSCNIEKMASGTPLNDDDRQAWLETLNQLISEKSSLVLACSALKPAYREILKKGNPDLGFLYLRSDFETVWLRHQNRDGHYFNGKTMLESQFNDLVEPKRDEAIFVDITQTPEQIVESAIVKMNKV